MYESWLLCPLLWKHCSNADFFCYSTDRGIKEEHMLDSWCGMLLSPFMMDIINILNVCPSSSLTLTNLLPFCPNDNSYTETGCSPASFLIQLNPGYSCLRRLSNEADFREATFSNEADFTGASFPSNNGRIIFCHIIFEQPNKVTFSKSNLSKVSFHGSDITRIKFGDKISWGGRFWS